MANLTLTTGVKDKVAYLLFSQAYASLTGSNAYQASIIDGEGASALTQLQMLGQYFTLAGGAAVASGGSGSATDAFEPVFVSLIKLRCAQNTQPERCAEYRKNYNDDLRALVGSFNRQNVDYAPTGGSAVEAFVYSMLSVRYYVLSHAVRLSPPVIPDIMTVDAAADEVLKSVWNRGGWRFRRRPALMTITRTAFTGGTYSQSGKTITVGSAPFTANTNPGTRVYITGGTGATLGEVPVASNTTTVLTLPNGALGSAADGQTDIAGFLVTVSFSGLEASEEFDSVASVRWYYEDSGHEGEMMAWLDADEFSRARAADTSGTTGGSGRPFYFRSHAIGTSHGWQFSPPPDASYTVRGEVLVRDPASPTTAAAIATEAPFTKFASEFLPVIRRAVLAQVLTNYSRTSAALSAAVADEIEARFPIYQDAGSPEERGQAADVYNDIDYLRGPHSNGMLGGAM